MGVPSEAVAPSSAWRALRGEFRQSEIENLGLASLSDKDIRRFDVTMHNSAGVGGIECVGNLYTQFEQLRGLERATLDHMLQGRAIQILHGDEGLPTLLADVIDGANIGVVESRCGLGLALETS